MKYFEKVEQFCILTVVIATLQSMFFKIHNTVHQNECFTVWKLDFKNYFSLKLSHQLLNYLS